MENLSLTGASDWLLPNATYSDELIYPNPSSGEVKIEFSLAQPERLDLSVFDESGRLVRRLLSKNLVPAGDFQVVWDGTDGGGQRLSGGVYFWKIAEEKGGASGGKVALLR